MRTLSILVLTAAAVTEGAPRFIAQPALLFAPAEGLMNEPVVIRVSGVRPAARVTVTATMQLAGAWHSTETVTVDSRGEAHLDGAQLFLLMSADDQARTAASSGPPDVREPVVTTVHLAQDGQRVASATYRRHWAAPGVRITDVREAGLVGQFFEPQGAGRHPAVLVIGGSEGGLDPYAAAGFASRGYAALAVAYFRSDSLPKELVNIPLEYFLSATDWLRKQRSVDAKRLAVYGKSRGSEAALLLASFSTAYKVAIAYAPSSVSWAGVGKHNMDNPAWTYRGEPIAYAPHWTTAATLREVRSGVIPIERSRAAIFLVSGHDDRVAPRGVATLSGDVIVERLKQHGHRRAYEHHSYPEAGHSVGMFYLPAPILAGGGGSPEGNAKAVADSTPKLFAFLRRNL